MSTLELMGRSPERQKHIATTLANRTLWVCFLNPEGYETYIQVHCDSDGTMTAEEPVPKGSELSTIQFWDNEEQVTIVPLGHEEDGPQYATVETLVERGALPRFTARSLAKRIGRQPYCNSPEYAIYPLLQLPEETPS